MRKLLLFFTIIFTLGCGKKDKPVTTTNAIEGKQEIEEKAYHSDSLAENILGKRISIQYTVPAIGIRDIIALQFEKDKSIIIAVKKDSKLSPDGGNYSYEVVDKEVQIISSNDKNLEAKFSSVTPMIGDKIIMNLGGEDLFEGKITRVEKAKKFDVDVKLLAVTTFDKDSVNLQDLTEKDGIFYDPKSSEPFSGKAFTLDPIIGQRKSSEGKILNGKTEGLWIHWHMDGEKHREENYKDGKLHGKQRIWFDSSSGDRWMSDEVTYDNGNEVEGSQKMFNRKGQQVKSMAESLR